MYRKIIFYLFPFLLLTFLFLKDKPTAKGTQITSRAVSSNQHIPKPDQPVILTPIRNQTAPKKIPNKKSSHKDLKNRLSQSVESTLLKDFEINLSRGHVFLKEIAAIPSKDYQESMGEVIKQDKNFIYFRAGENHSYAPVALSTSTNMLYPISTVLHVQGVNSEIRSELIKEGYQQYYYHAPLKLLFLQSGPDGVMKTYSDLLEKGYKVELEVLKPGHQTF